jgi:hypothetical protein
MDCSKLANLNITKSSSAGKIRSAPGNFKATSKKKIYKKINVKSPIGGVQYPAGQPISIVWDKNFNSKVSLVKIKLYSADGKLVENIKTKAENDGVFEWTPGLKLSWPGKKYFVLVSHGQSAAGRSGQFGVRSLKTETLDKTGTVINGYGRYISKNAHKDCPRGMVPPFSIGREPSEGEARIGHFLRDHWEGNCHWHVEYYFRSKVYFDLMAIKGREIIEAKLLVSLTEKWFKSKMATNEECSLRTDIYILDGPWWPLEQPLTDMYPGKFWKSFYIHGVGKTTSIDLTDLVRTWTGEPNKNHGIMIRDPLHKSNAVKLSVCEKFYSTFLLSVKYKE